MHSAWRTVCKVHVLSKCMYLVSDTLSKCMHCGIPDEGLHCIIIMYAQFDNFALGMSFRIPNVITPQCWLYVFEQSCRKWRLLDERSHPLSNEKRV